MNNISKEQELELLEICLFENIEMLLNEMDEFIPFGCVINQEYKPQIVSLDEELDQVEDFIQVIRKYITAELSDKNISSGAIAYMVIIDTKDYIQIELISTNSDGWFKTRFPFTKVNEKYVFGDCISEPHDGGLL
jgi:hypothetical protein